MNVLIAINHPSQYHVFKNLADKLMEDGDEVIFIIKKNKDILEELMISDDREYNYSVSAAKNRKRNKILLRLDSLRSILTQELSVFNIIRKNNFDFLLGTDIAISHIGKLFKIPTFVFCEDDYLLVKEFGNLTYPYAKHIVSPYICSIGKWEYKRLGYNGSQKTSYLHPKYFVPDLEILRNYGINKENYFIIRLVSMKAYHDILHETDSGIYYKGLLKLVNYLENKGKVYITSQSKLPEKLAPYRLNIDLRDIHHVIYYADLFIGDSQSMTIEAALLGTPSIRTNKWVVIKEKVSILEELENKYKLTYGIPPGDINSLIYKIEEITSINNFKTLWKEKRKEYFNNATNLTDYMFWVLNNYPDSIRESINNPVVRREYNLKPLRG